MKNLLPLVIAFTLLATASCKKSSDSNNTGSTSKGSWQIGSTTYQAKSVNSSLSGGLYELIAVSDSTTGGNAMITFIFNGGKPVTGSYPVDTSANSVYISCSTYSNNGNDIYNSGPATGVSAAVTVNGNTVKISVPSVNVTSVFSSNTTSLSASSITLY